MASRSSSYRCGLVGVAVWALLATAAALERYDELTPDGDTAYQDNNSQNSMVVSQRTPDFSLAKDVLLFKLIRSLQLGTFPSYPSKPPNRQQWSTEYQNPWEPSRRDEKDKLVKRVTEDGQNTSEKNAGHKAPDPGYRPQPKWKAKKGTQMICYFKLCAFLSPL